ncbi:hypothetical protein D1816_11330 [Aquimarina sp. AD10]|uniref:hypothetical protein n=1 Tax=Aquimarina sp. AD10 TaxID=1714849 RepID=UPI000E4D98A8|nr:hypothetical protein [Aquimarina sp. AD10]AXT60914.1 hypothetical protein D1816_11330 [Aquimarina sp. AD10]RKM95556.1 hypothetical protein D7033_16805 [Aquimarina sp. AD10]
MKKTISTLILVLFYLIAFPYQTEFVVTEGVEYGNSGPLSQGINTLNGNGTITIKGDIKVNGNVTIPEGIELNFFRGNKLKINGNVTVTINGSINAGSYQIFDLDDNGTVDDCFIDNFDLTKDDGKVNGNLKNDFVIPQWFGVDDTGSQFTSQLFQKAIEAFPNVRKFVANGRFVLDRMLYLNQSNRYYDFSGATFIGANSDSRIMCRGNDDLWNIPSNELINYEILSGQSRDNLDEYQLLNTSSIKGSVGGGMIAIGKYFTKEDTFISPYSVWDVTLYGGYYIPRYKGDVAIGIGNAKNIEITDVNINCYNGLRGIAIQPPTNKERVKGNYAKLFYLDKWEYKIDSITTSKISRTDHIILKNIIQQGGINIINIDIEPGTKHYVKNVVIDNVIGHEITGLEHLTGEKGHSFRLSSQNDGIKIENVSLSNIILSYVHGGFRFDGVTGSISNYQINAAQNSDEEYVEVNSFIKNDRKSLEDALKRISELEKSN